MASLAQKSQFWTDSNQTNYLNALHDPPQGAVDSAQWSLEQAQEVGDVDPDNNHPWEFRHTDNYKDQYDSQAMSHEQFA